MSDSPLMVLMMIGIGGYIAKLWLDDYRAVRGGQANARPLPGATPAPTRAIVIAVLGALLILVGETWGESVLGLTAEQSTITVLFGVYTLLAAIVEEIIFRGYIVIENRGPAARWAGIVGASLLFAALHPFLWDWNDGQLTWHFGAKGWFSTGAIFVGSLWFYTVRFMSWNPQRSLLPCFAAHAAKNLGVFAVKASQGFVAGWW